MTETDATADDTSDATADTTADVPSDATADDTADHPSDATADHPPDAGARRLGRRGRTARRPSRRAGRAAAGPGRSPLRRVLAGAIVLAAVFAIVMGTLWYLGRPDPRAGLSGPQQAAVDAARQEAINLQTFRRASFDQDFGNALAGLTEDYGTSQLQPKKAALQQQLAAGKVDASASVLSAGLVTSTATQATVLVVTNSVQTDDTGKTTPFVFSRLQLTLQLVGRKWLVADLTNIGLS